MKTRLPNKIFLLGYGAIGKCFTDILFKIHKNANLVVFDMNEIPKDERFQFKQMKIDKSNISTLRDHFKEGDVVVDLSTNVDVVETWSLCMEKGVNYMNTAMEGWEDDPNPNSHPRNSDELYRTTLLYRHDTVEKSPYWNSKQGTTTVFEHGMNPGLISHLVKKGIEDAANYFLQQKHWDDLNHKEIQKYLQEKNYPKLAQAMGLHTIHCSESDNQSIPNPPKDLKEKFYNTWSCRGFLTEGLVPIQVARGSHEDMEHSQFPRIENGKVIMSWGPSKDYWAKSWVPFEDIYGSLIPHGEAYTIREFLHDKETGYTPSQYYVYDFNPYAKEFIRNLPKDANVHNCNPEMEVIHPMNHKIHGYDKVGAMLIFKNNRGWWCGSIMDEYDASYHFNHKYGPTVLQVAGGVYGCFNWIVENPNAGHKWPDYLDSNYVLEKAGPYLGRIWSDFVDLKTTHLKDCYKFESFLKKL